MNKQTRDAVILAVALLALVIVGYFTFKQMQGDQVPPPPPAASATTPGTAPAAPGTAAATPGTTATPAGGEKTASAADTEPLSWIAKDRLPNIKAEVAGGRNPFMDLALPPTPPSISTPTNVTKPPSNPGTGHSTSVTPSEPGGDLAPMTLTRTLNYTTPQVLAAAFKKEHLDVNLKPTGRPNQVKLEGYAPDYDRAVELINELEKRRRFPISCSPGSSRRRPNAWPSSSLMASNTVYWKESPFLT